MIIINTIEMCGIHCVIGPSVDLWKNIQLSNRINHRGGDSSKYYYNTNDREKQVLLIHKRLSITGVNDGAQPLFSKDKRIVLVANGEVYNYKQLYEQYGFTPETHSDCEIFIHLYKLHGKDFMLKNEVSGMFGFVLYDTKTKDIIISRDHLGIIPLYTGVDEYDNFYVTSEYKSIDGICTNIKQYPPGKYSDEGYEYTIYYKPMWMIREGTKSINYNDFYYLMYKVVERMMDTNVSYGALMSGGLDSSIITALANMIHRKKHGTKLKTFCIGLKDSPDLKAAEELAEYLDTEHYSFTYTIKEGLEAIEKTIYHTETYDTTTIRAATPMVLMAEKIHALGVKMVLTGEGSDELWGSYAYFKYAPSAKEFRDETIRKLLDLKNYDLLRCNKSLMAYGIEGRVPFLDPLIIDYIMNLDTNYKIWNNETIEKYHMRKTFEECLPKNITWRKKEQFSDGVGYSWIDSIQTYAKYIMPKDYVFSDVVDLPETYEEKLYRYIFEKTFSTEALKTFEFTKSVACSSKAALKWLENIKTKDPSGRSINEKGFKIE